ncbi:MAG: ABC transporter permease [bacterium]|nr:ABC transporter permease [bacterium]
MNQFLHYIRAINAENIKEWKLELVYRADFVRQFIEPFVYLIPYLLYGMAVIGGRFSSHLKQLVGVSDMIAYTFIGYILMGFISTACWGMGFSLRKEQWYGTLESIFAAPVPRWVYIWGMALHSTIHQGLIMLVQLIAITIFFNLFVESGGIIPSLFIVVLMLLSLYGLGILIAGLTLTVKQGYVIAEAVYTLFSIATPIAYPIAVLPLFLQKVSLLLPTTYGIIGVRHYLVGEGLNISIPILLLRLFLLIILWVVFGLSIFIITDKRVRQRGTLAHY